MTQRLNSRDRNGRVRIGAACVGLLQLAAMQAARATTQDQADSDTLDRGVLEEVVVSAQRRQQNLQDVPVAATVVSAEVLMQQNINTLNSLTQSIPGVYVGNQPNGGNLFIRGIGSGSVQSFDQSVGTFIDDIYYGRARTSVSTFLDLDHVEVLKGPQSTFFGNNAIAGALSIVTKKPTDELDATVRALYGTYHQYAVEGGIGGPVSDTLKMRFAATANGYDGWIDNINTKKDEPRQNSQAARLSVAYEPSEDLNILLKLQTSRDVKHGTTFERMIDCPPPAPFVASGFCQVGQLFGLPTGLHDKRNSKKPDGTKLSMNEYVLTMNYQHNDHTFTSVTGFYNYHYRIDIDGDLTPIPFLTVHAPERYHQFSQELRVASPTGRPLEYLLGLYYQQDKLHFDQEFNYFFLTPTLQAIPPFAPLLPYLPLGQFSDFDQKVKSYAAFGSLTWNISDSWRFDAGLRATKVDKRYNKNLYYGTATRTYGGVEALPDALQPLAGFLGIGVPVPGNGSRKDDAILPSAKLQYRFGESAMAYASYSRGFKAGGFNGTDNTGVPANVPYDPEHVDAFEIGLKSKWFDDALLINIDAFTSKYTDLQVAVSLSEGGNIRSAVQNAGESRSQGVELETEWAVTRNFRLSLAATYLDSHYVTLPDAPPTQLQKLQGLASQDLGGEPTAFAPRWSGSLTASYRVLLPRGYELNSSASGFYTSHYFFDGTNDPTAEQGSYLRLDARVSLQSPDQRWAVALIGKNLTNRNIYGFRQAYPLSLGSQGISTEMPRNVALQVQYNW